MIKLIPVRRSNDGAVHAGTLREWQLHRVRIANPAASLYAKSTRYATAKADIFDYTKRFYNPNRHYSTSSYHISLIEFEKQRGIMLARVRKTASRPLELLLSTSEQPMPEPMAAGKHIVRSTLARHWDNARRNSRLARSQSWLGKFEQRG